MDRTARIDRNHCIISLVFAAAVVICVCVGVVMNLTTLYDEDFDHMGLRTFCMFTVNSNILTGICMFLTIPYSIEELRKRSYVVPGWLVELDFMMVTSVAITFLVSLLILAPVKGFVPIFTGSRFFLHGVCPILAILTFCFFIKDHYLPFRSTFLALIPVFIYASVYFVMVDVVGETRGGWNDFYGFLTRIPPWISLTLFMPVTFGAATALRLVHNASCRRFRRAVTDSLRQQCENGSLEDAVRGLAARFRVDNRADIMVPRRMIRNVCGLEEDGERLNELCRVYLEACLEDGGAAETAPGGEGGPGGEKQ
ncbi:MAG: hypothetical protein IIT70_00905 [Clostridia bacterium]|nr:hypothetical protein [Clostridia bacterium]MBR4636992.1 hypothetical protein [Clostridia bacterium]